MLEFNCLEKLEINISKGKLCTVDLVGRPDEESYRIRWFLETYVPEDPKNDPEDHNQHISTDPISTADAKVLLEGKGRWLPGLC
jgi:hypothetical protein